jgi:hypothetical protein
MLMEIVAREPEKRILVEPKTKPQAVAQGFARVADRNKFGKAYAQSA